MTKKVLVLAELDERASILDAGFRGDMSLCLELGYRVGEMSIVSLACRTVRSGSEGMTRARYSRVLVGLGNKPEVRCALLSGIDSVEVKFSAIGGGFR